MIKIDYKSLFLEEKYEFDIYNVVKETNVLKILTPEEQKEIRKLIKAKYLIDAKDKIRERCANYVKFKCLKYKELGKKYPDKKYPDYNLTFNQYLMRIKFSGYFYRLENKRITIIKFINNIIEKKSYGLVEGMPIKFVLSPLNIYNFPPEEGLKEYFEKWTLTRVKALSHRGAVDSDQIYEGYTMTWREYKEMEKIMINKNKN